MPKFHVGPEDVRAILAFFRQHDGLEHLQAHHRSDLVTIDSGPPDARFHTRGCAESACTSGPSRCRPTAVDGKRLRSAAQEKISSHSSWNRLDGPSQRSIDPIGISDLKY